MKTRGISSTTVLMALLLLMTASGITLQVSEGVEDKEIGPGTRISNMVIIDSNSTRFTSGGITQWGSFCYGIVNRTTSVQTRLKNTIQASLTNIAVNFTIYWYDAQEGFSFDRGKVMHRDFDTVSVGGGDGTLSRFVRFEWIPKFAGAYVMNISAHVPGDPHPITSLVWAAGVKYTVGESSLYNGLWVGTQFYNCSSSDGWRTEAESGPPGLGWHISNHSLGGGYDWLHTEDGVFWAGNEGTGRAPVSGTYSLITPELNLTSFDPKPYNRLEDRRRPMIYLLYKYRGNLSSSGPNGEAGIYHYISTDDGENWEALKDIKNETVVIKGNSTERIWNWVERPSLRGDAKYYGIDLGAYQGLKVRIKLEYRPSGVNETGYVLDDFVIIGKETVDVTPFEVKGDVMDVGEVEPGSEFKLSFNITSRESTQSESIWVRSSAVDGIGYLDLDRDVTVEPEIFELSRASSLEYPATVSIDVPSSAPAGPGWVVVRTMGGGFFRDLRFHFTVSERHNLISSLEGRLSGNIDEDQPVHLSLVLSNQGNIREDAVYLRFVSSAGLSWNGPESVFDIDPGDRTYSSGNVTLSGGSGSGLKKGYFIISPDPIVDREEELISDIVSGSIKDYWTIHEVEYEVDQVFEVQLSPTSSTSTHRTIDEPPSEGTETLNYTLFLTNYGNGYDLVEIRSIGLGGREDIIIDHPENIDVGPGDTKVLVVSVYLLYPIPFGIYNLTISCISSGEEDRSDNDIELTFTLGRAPVSEGLFLVNGSLSFEPNKVVLGKENIIFFTVRSYGFLPSSSFNVNLVIEGKVLHTTQFNVSSYKDRVHQIPWTFSSPGLHRVNVTLSESLWSDHPDDGLVSSLSGSVYVHLIDMGIASVGIADFEPGSDEKLSPGRHDIIVSIVNSGDHAADLVTLTLSIIQQDGARTDIVRNLSEIEPGVAVNVTFNDIPEFEPERKYRISASIDNRGRWAELNEENDFKDMEVATGDIPPEEPVWKDPTWGLVGLGITFVLSSLLFLYLVRKKF